MNQSESSSLHSPLSISKELWPWCLWTICLLTIAWTAVVTWAEVSSGRHADVLQASVAVGSNTADAVPLIIVYAIFSVVTASFIRGGGIMVVGRAARAYVDAKIEKRRDRLRAEGRAQGHAEGRAEGRVAMATEFEDWNRRRKESEERGEPFDEPPPSV